MPSMTGLEVTASIRQWENQNTRSNREIPIILMSGDYNEEFEQECKEAGVNEVLQKPVAQTRIKEILDQYVYN